eukprot:CAMPEP_0197543266 /NCGR_PEP_ID=MMETSP1318-20131121/68105_1 /TAXON_ID=552666 /ORGANISM="Partenskyella glossopodia, Strain RCC365" /LENGTH=295 /DNA_ID=CAMNT_0043102587 /DNA_START=896 /DNA_END=1783 /DNA_ORIENTATION=-
MEQIVHIADEAALALLRIPVVSLAVWRLLARPRAVSEHQGDVLRPWALRRHRPAVRLVARPAQVADAPRRPPAAFGIGVHARALDHRTLAHVARDESAQAAAEPPAVRRLAQHRALFQLLALAARGRAFADWLPFAFQAVDLGAFGHARKHALGGRAFHLSQAADAAGLGLEAFAASLVAWPCVLPWADDAAAFLFRRTFFVFTARNLPLQLGTRRSSEFGIDENRPGLQLDSVAASLAAHAAVAPVSHLTVDWTTRHPAGYELRQLLAAGLVSPRPLKDFTPVLHPSNAARDRT